MKESANNSSQRERGLPSAPPLTPRPHPFLTQEELPGLLDRMLMQGIIFATGCGEDSEDEGNTVAMQAFQRLRGQQQPPAVVFMQARDRKHQSMLQEASHFLGPDFDPNRPRHCRR